MAKTRIDKRGQMIAEDLMPPTLMTQTIQKVLKEEYHKAKGNISLTARRVGWSRPKTLKMIKDLGLYKLYKHDPWPVSKGED